MKPRHRQSSKPNKRFAKGVSQEQLEEWIKGISYTGNAEHKRNPGDFGLSPPYGPRRGKTLCDGVKIFKKALALKLLKKGVRFGMVSEQMRGTFPQNIWAVADDGTPLEAALDNQETGSYHGYPMWTEDEFAKKVLAKWKSSDD
ncbi:MAG: hypothetical protein JJT96_07760 [Opitutales bacterium]|nr:hypothetical protein [Opitutales bacterium]